MGNSVSNYAIIRVQPTLDTNAYAQYDVLFTATAIPNAVRGNGGCSKLVAMYVLDQSDNSDDMWFVFSEGQTALGTINATANISDANILANKNIGLMKLDSDQAGTAAAIDTSKLHQVLGMSGTGESADGVMLLQAAAGTTSVYVQGIVGSNTTPTFADGDIELIFHIQYK